MVFDARQARQDRIWQNRNDGSPGIAAAGKRGITMPNVVFKKKRPGMSKAAVHFDVLETTATS